MCVFLGVVVQGERALRSLYRLSVCLCLVWYSRGRRVYLWCIRGGSMLACVVGVYAVYVCAWFGFRSVILVEGERVYCGRGGERVFLDEEEVLV